QQPTEFVGNFFGALLVEIRRSCKDGNSAVMGQCSRCGIHNVSFPFLRWIVKFVFELLDARQKQEPCHCGETKCDRGSPVNNQRFLRSKSSASGGESCARRRFGQKISPSERKVFRAARKLKCLNTEGI